MPTKEYRKTHVTLYMTYDTANFSERKCYVFIQFTEVSTATESDEKPIQSNESG